MKIEILTKDDLQEFKNDLLSEIRDLLKTQPAQKKWLKSNEVKEILGCSDGTLQNLRINGTLEYSRVGGTVYYPYDAVLKLLESNKVTHKH